MWPKTHDSAEYIHIYNDGIQKSPFLEFGDVSDFATLNRTVWIGLAYIQKSEDMDESVDDVSKDIDEAEDKAESVDEAEAESDLVEEAEDEAESVDEAEAESDLVEEAEDEADEYEFKDWCAAFLTQLLEAQTNCQKQGHQNCFWHVYIINYKDWVDEDSHCPEIEEIMKNATGADPHQEYVHYYQRSIAIGRYFNDDTQWIDPGKRLPEFHHASTEPSSTLSFPSLGITARLPRHGRLNFPVRSDVVRNQETILREEELRFNPDGADAGGGSRSSLEIMERLERPFDLAHFWGMKQKDSEDDHYPYFRLRVSLLLDEYCNNHNNKTTTTTIIGGTNSTASTKPLSCFIGLAGENDRAGRRKSGRAYIQQMLRTKIVVVTQRDQWEDHYRLMEALVSGAMVLTDEMLSLPNGYVDGKSLVVFSSADDLLQKLTFYLQHNGQRIAIAIEGRRLAMEQHRSWHRMEEVVFGRILTTPELSHLVVGN